MKNSTNGSTEHRKPLYVVGIGASAGGMEALHSFLRTLTRIAELLMSLSRTCPPITAA
ncbi:hypothetical protein N6H14_01375 [Paenibacillus sp. CC-CFT747]|nr:hypothetical protein N6H14_01375 [Paenibacillus sp. CC-CFT747]